jgi:hypothetical protein
VIGLGLALVLAWLAAIIGSRTRRWLYLAVTTFVLVGIFEGYLAYSRESSVERVRGAAVIRDNKKATVGLFVAESADRVYLARVSDEEGDTIVFEESRLVGISKEQVSDVAIGDRKSITAALNQGVHLAKELCELQLKIDPPAEGTVEDCRTAPPGYEQP